MALDFLRSLPTNEALPLSTLSQKLALLLALTAPKRSSELKMLDLRFMRFLPEGVVFQLPGLTKTSSDVKSVFFAKFDDCEKLCVVHCLQSYIERTKAIRQPLAPDIACQLLVSYHRPHKPVKSCSIARWIKTILTRAGINTKFLLRAILRGQHPLRKLQQAVYIWRRVCAWLTGPERPSFVIITIHPLVMFMRVLFSLDG